MRYSTVPLRHVADVRVSNVDKKSVEGEKDVLLCNYTDVYYENHITSDIGFMPATASNVQIAQFSLRAGDCIITKDSETADDIAVSAFVSESLPGVLCGYHLALLRPRREVDGRFFSWAIQSGFVREQWATTANGVTRYGLNYGSIRGAGIPLPPLELQRRIADFLDDQVARIDRAIQLKNRQLELVTDLWQGIVDAQFESLGSDFQPIARACEVVVDCVNKTAPTSDVQTPFRMIRTTNIRDGLVDLTDTNSVDEQTFRVWNRRGVPRRGDVLFTREAPLGEVGILDSDEFVFLGQRLVLFRADRQRILPKFLLYSLMTSKTQRGIDTVASGSLHPHLRVGDCSRLEVPDTDLKSQESVVQAVDLAHKDAESAKRSLRRSISLCEERKRSLVTAAVTGEFDVSSSSRAADVVTEGVGV